MKKLMIKYDFAVAMDEKEHLHVMVTRLADKAEKSFYQAHGTLDGMVEFLCSITDDLADGYFPKPRKK